MGQNYGPIFRRLCTKVHQIMSADAGESGLQRRADILFHFGDIHDRSVKSSEITRKKRVFRPQNCFGGSTPKFWTYIVFFKIALISDHVAKFRGDRPRDRRDVALNKKRKKETAAKQKGRKSVCVITQRAALNGITICRRRYLHLTTPKPATDHERIFQD